MPAAVPLINLRSPTLFADCPVTAAVRALAAAGIEQRGAVFTRREVAEFILDLAGYTSDRPLTQMRLLEPSFGDGDFLIPAIDRLLDSWTQIGRPAPYQALADAIRAVELHQQSYEDTHRKIVAHLGASGIGRHAAESLADQWLIFGDFLLIDLHAHFDVVIGNPPYVRQELIADALMTEYRARYRTIYDRADIDVPFIEHALQSLTPSGLLAFICADRWMKNRYGGPLRQFVADDFHLQVYVDMVDTPAFHTAVIAYPAIVVIGRGKGRATRVARRPAINSQNLTSLRARIERHPEA